MLINESQQYCSECQYRAAIYTCDVCLDYFCNVCYRAIHKSGVKLNHTFTVLNHENTTWKKLNDEIGVIYYNIKKYIKQRRKPIELMNDDELLEYFLK